MDTTVRTEAPIDIHPEIFRREADALGSMIHDALAGAARVMYEGLADIRAAEAATRETDQARQFAEAAEAALRKGAAVADRTLAQVDSSIAFLEKFVALAEAPAPGPGLAREIRAHLGRLDAEARVEALWVAIHEGDVHLVAAVMDAPRPLREQLLTEAQYARLRDRRDDVLTLEHVRRARAKIEVTRAARAKLANARALFEREVRAVMPKQVVTQNAVDAALAALRDGVSV